VTPPATTPNGFDWNGFITLVTGVVGLAAAFLTLQQIVRSHPENITAPLDPQITTLKIERHALDQDIWEQRRTRKIHKFLQFLIISHLTVIIFIISLLFSLKLVTFDWNFIIAMIVLIPIIIAWHFFSYYLMVYFLRSPDEMRFKNAEEGKFYVFQKADIFVEGDINYIYAKTQEAIRGKNVQNIEVDGNARKIEAYQRNSFRKTAGNITVVMKPANETAQCYSIDVDFRSGASTSNILASNARSKFINEFIGKLLTKEAPAGESGK
jgi:hypothetical protein